MPVTVSHALSATTPDDPAYEIQPQHWNSGHLVTINAVGSEISGAFDNSNGVSFGLQTNGKITASTPAYLTTAMASNRGTDFVQATAAFAGTNASGTIASNGISVSVGNYLTTAAMSNHSHGFSAQGGSSAFQTLNFSNQNNVSFSNSNGQVVASASFSQTNQTVGLYAVGNTTGQSSSTTVDARSVSYQGAGELSVGFSNGSVVVSANVDALSAYANSNTTQSSSGTLQVSSLNFAGAGGVSVGVSNGSVVISAPSGGGGTTNQTGPNIAAGGATVTDGTVVFSNSNNITFGLNGSTMTASYGDPVESLFWRPSDLLTTVGAPINASASVVYVPMDHNLSASRFDLIASINVATAANNSSAGVLYSITACIYTKNGGTLSSLSSATTNNQMTWTSNATGSVTGGFFLSVPLNVNAVADKYWVAVQLSTRATGLTGAATTSLANTVSLMGVGSAVFGAVSVREPGAATANSNGWVYGLGMYSGTSNFSTIGLSNLTQQGTNANRANVGMRMINV